ncbi:hypothetical protein PIGHUM_04597 [Pigmentiphaga humi]|uniref:Uncharacterized protein n=1 Tax=Pigmentiphaga humi TaxID=2478468 RepID=A0A3P4B851_9BURK|nr:hypothetical protein PIGHUM_04597 [Pigmentiphaga humi]
MAFKKALIERALGAELGHHYARGRSAPRLRPAQWQEPQDGAHRRLPFAGGHSPRPGRQLRSDPDSQARATLHGVRRADHRRVCPGHVRARDPGVPGQELRHRGLAGLHQLSHRRGHGRDDRLAEPSAGGAVPGPVLRCAAGQESATRPTTWRWERCRTAPGTSWACGSNRPRAPSSGGLRQLEGSAHGGGGAQAHLHRAYHGGRSGGRQSSNRGRGGNATRRSWTPGAGLGPSDPILYVPASHPQGDLHHQRYREHQCAVAPGGQNAGPLPQRRGGRQAALC